MANFNDHSHLINTNYRRDVENRNIGNEIEDVDEMEEVTSSDLIARIQRGWENEKLSTGLLIPLGEEVVALRTEMIRMEKNMSLLKSSDIRLSSHRLELKRLRFLICGYLRVRLLKIQEHPWHYAAVLDEHKGPHPYPYILDEEAAFLKEYLQNTEIYLVNAALNYMPVPCRRFLDSQLRRKPSSFRFVFLECYTDLNVPVEDADGNKDTIQLQQGNRYIMRLEPIRRNLEIGKLRLL